MPFWSPSHFSLETLPYLLECLVLLVFLYTVIFIFTLLQFMIKCSVNSGFGAAYQFFIFSFFFFSCISKALWPFDIKSFISNSSSWFKVPGFQGFQGVLSCIRCTVSSQMGTEPG